MTPSLSPLPNRCRLAITVRGVVQGVGFRPFVYHAARQHDLAGWVQNESGMVHIEAEGDRAALERFLEALRHAHPPQARVDALEAREIACQAVAAESAAPAAAFTIRSSLAEAAPLPTIPADLATCDLCLAEITDPAQRRYQYPFTNCTNCGPRLSIIRQLPYDRPRTSMAEFPLCPECRAEYLDPADRRFHAQPIACPRCGPTLQLLDARGEKIATAAAALDLAVQAVLEGRIVAVKGLGGFQLLADATNADAVKLLRQRKRRPDRPFALMFPSLEEVGRHCEVSAAEARALAGHEAPILLLRRLSSNDSQSPPPGRSPGAFQRELTSPERRPGAFQRELTSPERRPGAFQCESTSPERSPGAFQCESTSPERSPGAFQRELTSPERSPGAFLIPNPQSLIPPVVAPDNPYLGAMLPYTPLHHLLLAAIGRPVVCTSGNLSEEPMAITTEDALARLGDIADLLLVHNRPIVRPVDDSVARLDAEGLQVLRRARGYAPLPIELDAAGPTILAVGGHLKNTIALGIASQPMQVVLSPHVGDLDSVAAVEVFRRAIDDLVEFFQATPEVVACDLHPDYASTLHAEQLAARWKAPLRRVQHHHAHVAACMAEHRLAGPVLGLAWDGTGYGCDGTIWGGEALLCRGGEFARTAHLRTFSLPGGDQAMHQPRRSALGMLYEILGEAAAEYVVGGGDWFSRAELKVLLAALDRSVNCPRTSSMGRLFDAVAALCGLPRVISFEGQAAMSLEFAADGQVEEAYPLPLGQGSPAVADWEPMLRAVLADRAAGVPLGMISARFHNALAEFALAAAQRADVPQVVLSGGCFQNALLGDRVRRRLLQAGFSVYTHRRVPPGDGGIALGQVWVAASDFQENNV